MVRRIFYFLVFWVFSLSASVDISVSLDTDTASPGQPVQGRIFIKYPQQEKVTEKDFVLDGQPLQTKFMNRSRQSFISVVNGQRRESHENTDVYAFEIPGRDVGKYRLPVIGVRVGGNTYYAPPIEYEIFDVHTHSGFRLSYEIKMPRFVYPGQKITALYRLTFTNPMEIVLEDLPLMEAEGFDKIGEVKVRFYRRGGSYVKEYERELVAKYPGIHSVGEARAEGFCFREDFFGRREYVKPKLRAELPSSSLEILSFPKQGKPDSFNGVIIPFTMKAELLSPQKVYLGDKIRLRLALRGDDPNILHMPLMSEQKSFAASFRFSDLPAGGSIENNEKIFIAELRVMDESLTQIPEMEYSYFDPNTREYRTGHTSAIPMEVVPRQVQVLPSLPSDVVVPDLQKEINVPETIDIRGVYPLEDEKTERRFFLPVFFGCLILLFFRYRYERRNKKKKNSSFYLEKAFQTKGNGDFYFLLEKAFELRVKEKKLLRYPDHAKNFLLRLQEHLYSPSKQENPSSFFEEAAKVYGEIHS